MKWIKTAIGALIAISSIGIISISVFKMTQSSKVIKEVSFETDIDEETYYPISIYNEILEYGVTDEYDDELVINIVSCYVNNNEPDDFAVYIKHYDIIIFDGYIISSDGIIGFYYEIEPDGDLFKVNDIEDDVTIKLVFAVPQPPQLTGISATLILLIPLIFAGGVVLYFYNPFKKERG